MRLSCRIIEAAAARTNLIQNHEMSPALMTGAGVRVAPNNISRLIYFRRIVIGTERLLIAITYLGIYITDCNQYLT